MEQLVIAAASNIDHVEIGAKISKEFLNGASIYSGFAAAEYVKPRVITCIGSEDNNREVLKRMQTYKDRDEKFPDFNIIEMKNGKSFKQTFGIKDGKLGVVNKDYGNYNDWAPKIESFKTNVLLLGTGNPIFQKCVLQSCIQANHILLDSKLIHFQKRQSQMDSLIKKTSTLFGTQDEIEQLLRNCRLPLTMTPSLFEQYPNLQTIIEKSGKKGGRVFTNSGKIYTYRPAQPTEEMCTDGAGDVFAGVYAALLSNGENLEDIIIESAKLAAESVKYFGINKVKLGISKESSKTKILIEESRWRVRNEPIKEYPDRSD